MELVVLEIMMKTCLMSYNSFSEEIKLDVVYSTNHYSHGLDIACSLLEVIESCFLLIHRAFQDFLQKEKQYLFKTTIRFISSHCWVRWGWGRRMVMIRTLAGITIKYLESKIIWQHSDY